MKNKITSSIILHNLELAVHLGWSDTELSKKQIICADIKITFVNPPNACITDDLSHTFCYDQLINEIKEKIHSHTFRLLEHLGYELYQYIKMLLTHNVLASIRVTKKPLIANLMGGVSFCYGDEENVWSF